MLKKILYQNQPLKDYLDKSKFDILIVQNITWEVDEFDQCVPFITGKLVSSLPEAHVCFHSKYEDVFSKLVPLKISNLMLCN